MFIFKTAKVWRDLAQETPSADRGSLPAKGFLAEDAKDFLANERDGAEAGTAPQYRLRD